MPGSDTVTSNVTVFARLLPPRNPARVAYRGSNRYPGSPMQLFRRGFLAVLVLVGVVAAGGYHNCAVDGVGQSWCWGRGDFYQMGNNSTSDSNVPTAVSH